MKGSLMFFIPFFFFVRPIRLVGFWKKFLAINYFYRFLSFQTKTRRNSRKRIRCSFEFELKKKREVHSLRRISTHFAAEKGVRLENSIDAASTRIGRLEKSKLRSSIVNWNMELNNCPVHFIIVLWPLAFCAVLNRVSSQREMKKDEENMADKQMTEFQ